MDALPVPGLLTQWLRPGALVAGVGRGMGLLSIIPGLTRRRRRETKPCWIQTLQLSPVARPWVEGHQRKLLAAASTGLPGWGLTQEEETPWGQGVPHEIQFPAKPRVVTGLD